MQARSYQQEILELAVAKADTADRSLIQLPTGMGKTVCFALLIKELQKRSLIIAHRQELLTQAAQKLVDVGIDGTIDIVLQSQPDPYADHWVASIQTIMRGDRLDLVKPEIIIIDEAHHSAAKSYITLIERFPDVPIFGFTATPTRSSPKEKKILAQLWDEVLYSMSVRKAILDGWLANIEYYLVQSDVSLDGVKTSRGDFAVGELADRVDVHARNQACVEKYLELGGGKAVAFSVNVAHAQSIADYFKVYGIDSYVLTGKTKKDERKQILDRLATADMNENIVVANCGVLVEGWDCPDLRQVILARPTKSEIAYLQMIGRGTRKAEGKEVVKIIDIADNFTGEMCNCLRTVFNLNTNVMIEGNILAILEEKRKAHTSGGGSSPSVTEEEHNEDVAQENAALYMANLLFDIPKELDSGDLAWIATEENTYHCKVSHNDYLKIETDMLRYTLLYNNELYEMSADIREIATSAIEAARTYHGDTRYMWSRKIRNRGARDPMTEKQEALLRKIHPDLDLRHVSKSRASELIAAHIAKRREDPPTAKQLRLISMLGWHGKQPNTKHDASRIIERLKEA